jgi:glyoxylase-like metal-dependent hydrolase (beta-lactamase superfamily II)
MPAATRCIGCRTLMDVHLLNCFTCCARVPAGWHSGTLCLLVETGQGLVLVDTGPGLDDYLHPDFPQARVHVHRREVEAFASRPHRWTDLAYVRRHVAHRSEFVLYEKTGERWFDWPAIRLPFEPEMWLVPLFGHTRGHCGVAIRTPSGWLFHVGDAAPMGLTQSVPG